MHRFDGTVNGKPCRGIISDEYLEAISQACAVWSPDLKKRVCKTASYGWCRECKREVCDKHERKAHETAGHEVQPAPTKRQGGDDHGR